jgi:hypothetical protein
VNLADRWLGDADTSPSIIGTPSFQWTDEAKVSSTSPTKPYRELVDAAKVRHPRPMAVHAGKQDDAEFCAAAHHARVKPRPSGPVAAGLAEAGATTLPQSRPLDTRRPFEMPNGSRLKQPAIC